MISPCVRLRPVPCVQPWLESTPGSLPNTGFSRVEADPAGVYLNEIRKSLSHFPSHNSRRALHIVDSVGARLLHGLCTHDAQAQLLHGVAASSQGRRE